MLGDGDDLGLGLADARAHLAQAAQVLLHAAGSDVVAARARHAGMAESGKQGAEEDDRGAHPPAELVGHVIAGDPRGVDDDGAVAFRLATEEANDVAHDGGVRDSRDVA